MASKLNKHSSRLTQEKRQGASQAMLYATGLTEEDMNKPQVGVASMWYEGNPCNMHLLDLANLVSKGVKNAGLVSRQFNTIGVSDGISMGTDGMSYSLQSRDLIADSIETSMGAHFYDGLIALPGCDKNMPGCLIAMGRLDRPSIMVYGGTIRAGKIGEEKIDVVNAFQSFGACVSGRITEDQRLEIVRNACPGAGACGGMYTANTMATAAEAMGMSLPFSSSSPAESKEKKDECDHVGTALLNLLDKDITPRKIMTKEAFENSIITMMAVGGSTNAILHLLAIAHAVDVDLHIDDFQRLTDKTPLLADFKPSGQFVMEDLQNVGGIPAVMKYLLSEGMLHGNCLTVTGKTIEENLAEVPSLSEGQKIVTTVAAPLKKTGHLQILKGNLAPDGSVAKITGKEGETFKGTARCFDSEEEMLQAFEDGKIKKGDVIVIRYEGPKGGPGMPEMLSPTSAIMGAGMGKDVALITDGRFSGGSHGFIVGHITPEAQVGGPIALIQDDDKIEIDAVKNAINVELSDEEFEKRRAAWTAPPLKATKGTLKKYTMTVQSASRGCITDSDE